MISWVIVQCFKTELKLGRVYVDRREYGLAGFTFGIGEVNGKLGRLALKQEAYYTAISQFLLAIGSGTQRLDQDAMGESIYHIGLAYLRAGEHTLAVD